MAIVFFSKLLSPLDTLATAIRGPASTLHTVFTLSQAAYQCLRELRNDLTSVVSEAVKLAADNGLETELRNGRSRKVSRRLDSSAENEVTLSPTDALKREMIEIV